MTDIKPKVKKLYYSISEVSKLTNLKAYVLRYWESEFSKLKPTKNRAGNRTYRQKDIDLILEIKNLLYSKKFTIKGAKSVLSLKNENKKNDRSDVIIENKKIFKMLKNELEEILLIIRK